MKIIIGHSNMDLDCIASIALARRLHPDHIPIKSGTIHPVARHLYNLYETELEFLPAKELKGETVTDIVIVDTRARKRVQEYFRYLGSDDAPPDCAITIYDHHPGEPDDLPGATLIGGAYGSTATILGLELEKRGIDLTPAEATIALAGIYSDTGNFTHADVDAEEFRAAAYLIRQGATVRVVTSFLKSLREDAQVELFHEALSDISYTTIKGHSVATFVRPLEKQTPGLAAVVERVFEIEHPDALFGIFPVDGGSTVIIGRSRKARIEVNTILKEFGGGGHFKAASAVMKNGAAEVAPEEILSRVLAQTHSSIAPALTTKEIMTREVEVIRPGWNLIQASIFLERIDHTGAPVVSDDGEIMGFLTLRDIMKGRKRDRMNSPVKGFMTQRVITAGPEDTLRDLERSFFDHDIGHLPVTDTSGSLLGIVTRTDYLRIVEQGTPQ